MIIVIEGMDGAGKTTVAKKVASRLGAKYVDNVLFGYLQENGFTQGELASIRRAIDVCSDSETSVVRAWLYGFANLFNLVHYAGEKNLVIDRHFLTNYYYNGDENSQKVYEMMEELAGKPDLVIILKASSETRLARIAGRNSNDKDLKKLANDCSGYDKMEEGARRLKLNYKIVSTDNKAVDSVVEEIVKIVKENALWKCAG